MAPTIDALIIGGGPAGLSTALTLARQIQSSIIFDDGTYRNKRSNDMHMMLTADNEDPATFREKARENLLSRYDFVKIEETQIVSVKKIDGGFEVEDVSEKTWQGKKLVLATGVDDIYPNIEGYDECWTKGIYHCFFCKGYEDRGASSSGLLAVDMLAQIPYAMHAARHATPLSKKVVIYTNGNEELASQFRAAFNNSPVFTTNALPITKLSLPPGSSGGAITLHFANGTSTTEAFLGHAPLTKAKGPFAEQLGLEVGPMGDLVVKPPFQQTSVQGVFAAGDCCGPFKIAPNAQFTGSLAGAGVSSQILAEGLGQQGII